MCRVYTGLLCVVSWLIHLQGSDSCSVDFQACEDSFLRPVQIGLFCLKEAENRTIERSKCYRKKLEELESNRDCTCAEQDVHHAIVNSAPHDVTALSQARCTVNKPPTRRCRLTNCLLGSRKLRVFLRRKKRRPGATCGRRSRRTKSLISRCMSELKRGDKNIQDCGNVPFYMARYGKLYVAYISVLCSDCDISEVTRPCNRVPTAESSQPCYAVQEISKMRNCGLEQVKQWEKCGAAAVNFVRVSWDLAEEQSKRACYAQIYAQTMMDHWGCKKNDSDGSVDKKKKEPDIKPHAGEKLGTREGQPAKKDVSGKRESRTSDVQHVTTAKARLPNVGSSEKPDENAKTVETVEKLPQAMSTHTPSTNGKKKQSYFTTKSPTTAPSNVIFSSQPLSLKQSQDPEGKSVNKIPSVEDKETYTHKSSEVVITEKPTDGKVTPNLVNENDTSPKSISQRTSTKGPKKSMNRRHRKDKTDLANTH